MRLYSIPLFGVAPAPRIQPVRFGENTEPVVDPALIKQGMEKFGFPLDKFKHSGIELYDSESPIKSVNFNAENEFFIFTVDHPKITEGLPTPLFLNSSTGTFFKEPPDYVLKSEVVQLINEELPRILDIPFYKNDSPPSYTQSPFWRGYTVV